MRTLAAAFTTFILALAVGAACGDDGTTSSPDASGDVTTGGTPCAPGDDAACDDGDACTTDRCGADGTCQSTPALDVCEIAGVCYAHETPQPGNACLECNIGRSKTEWSAVTCVGQECQSSFCNPSKGCVYNPLDDGLVCDDGDPCTTNELCAGGKCQAGQVPCVHGTCAENPTDGSYVCTCEEQWTGKDCDTRKSTPCDPNPCKNNGTCALVGADGFECTCAPNFVGDTCETFKPDPCSPNPCLNGGTCTKDGNGYACDCPLGWVGDDCELVDGAACDPNPCQNGGTCTDAGGTPACECAEGFEGDLCQDAIDYCDPNPCLNNGSCVSLGLGFSCVCPSGFSGDTCEVSTACEDAPCANGGTCVAVEGGRVCACAAGWGGLDCDVAGGRLASFKDHTCGINDAGTTLCWGASNTGQLAVPADVTFAALGAARVASCGIVEADGTLQCWSTFGAMTTVATSAAAFGDLALGDQHGCARDGDSAVTCWGTDQENETKVPAANFLAVAAATTASCGVQTDGTLSCWGALPTKFYSDPNFLDGMPLCNAECTGTCKPDPVIFWEAFCEHDLTPPEGVFGQVAGGTGHFCALDLAGKPHCWGDRTGGKANSPDLTLRYVAAGDRASCGIDSSGAIVCWGDATLESDAPAGTTWVALAVGGRHACAIAADGTITCWGTSTTGAATPPAEW